MGDKRATLADVARRAGLSPTAASMILNGRPDARLSEDAHRRVHQAALELDYRPNIAARSLRTSKSATIGFISDSIATTRFANRLIAGALAAADEAGNVLLVLETGGDRGREEQAFRAALDRQVDGVIFASMRSREVVVPTMPDGTGLVVLNALSSQAVPTVLPDEEAGGRAAVALLAECGRAASAVLLGHSGEREQRQFRSTTVARRLHGIRGAMAEAGAGFVEEISIWEWEAEAAYEQTRALLARRRDFGAMLCLNDRLAFGAHQAIRDAGLSIPEDVALVSFDDDEIASYARPALTTVALPHAEMGRRAVELLLSQAPPSEVLVPMPVVRRGSL